jgi:hypothetical protein
MLRLITLLVFVIGLTGCKDEPRDPQQVEFEKKFDHDAVLVRTCPADPRYASGPTAAAQRVYRYERELWFVDVGGPRKLEATPETACDVLVIPREADTSKISNAPSVPSNALNGAADAVLRRLGVGSK